MVSFYAEGLRAAGDWVSHWLTRTLSGNTYSHAGASAMMGDT